MAISFTYSSLLSTIQEYTEDDSAEFVAAIPTIIGLAELKIAREVDLTTFRKQSTIALSNGVQTGIAPTDLIVPRWLQLASTGAFLLPKDESFILELTGAGLAGTPRYYSFAQAGTSFIFSPTPNASFTVNIGYTYRPAALTSINTTTWLATNAGDVLLYACLLESMGFMKEEIQEFEKWKALYSEALAGLQNEEMARKRSDEYRLGEFR